MWGTVWNYLTAPWFARLLRDVALTRGIMVGTVVLGVARVMRVTLMPCPFMALTGLPCPGCGMTRATEALLRGDWSRAMTFHPYAPFFLVLGLVMAASLIVPASGRETMAKGIEAFERSTPLLAIIMLTFAIYGLLRMGQCCFNENGQPFPPTRISSVRSLGSDR